MRMVIKKNFQEDVEVLHKLKEIGYHGVGY